MGLAIVIIVLDTTLLNVSLGTILKELRTDIQSLQWVITAYSLTLAALTITGGRFGDLFGRKKMFIVGAIIFAIGSLIASMSRNVGQLIAGEAIIEGIGAALMMPATASLLVSTYKGRERAMALGVWGGMAALGSAIGPLVGGWLTSNYSWRWGFRINVFVAALLVLGSILVKEARDMEEKPTIDWMGVLLSSFGLLCGVFGIIESTKYGWWAAKQPFSVGSSTLGLGGISIVPLSLILSVILLVLFVFWEQYAVKRGWTPLVSMKIFLNRQFSSGAVTSMVLAMGQAGMIFGLPVFLQGVKGLDALHTGYYMIPLSVALFIAAPLGGFISSRFFPKRIVQVGLLANMIGLLLLRFSLNANTSQLDLVLPLSLYGFGVGLGMSQLGNLTLSAVPLDEVGEASGVNNTLRQIGQSLGSAIIGSILIVTLTSSLRNSIATSGSIPENRRQVIAEEIASQASAVEFGAAVRTSSVLDSSEQSAIKSLANASTITANKNALLMTIAFTLLALLVSTRLPLTKDLEHRRGAAAH